jgi:hypothetical protein
MWLCQCSCGEAVRARASTLIGNQLLSCGCLKTERLRQNNLSYGHTCNGVSPTYESWAGMISRCENPNRPNFLTTVAEGIRVCERWRNSFEAFLKDMGPRPVGTSIDRIDNSDNYEPGICRWATRSEQQRNQRPRAPRRLRARAPSARGALSSRRPPQRCGDVEAVIRRRGFADVVDVDAAVTDKNGPQHGFGATAEGMVKNER